MIYFIQEGGKGNVKIGRTSGNPYIRLRQMQCGNSKRLNIIGVASEEFTCEKDWHEALSEDHVRGEWFKPSERLFTNLYSHMEAELSLCLDG